MNPVTLRLRLVLLGIAVGCFYKIAFFRLCDHCYFEYPIRDSFFPGWLQDAWTIRIAYLVLLVGILIAAFSDRRRWIWTGWFILLSCLTVLNLHQGSYNDMTFLTAWWCGLWGLWVGSRLDVDAPERLLAKASLVGRVMLSIVLLGGAVGKWTDEYWSGQVLYEIYFVDRDFWTFNFVRRVADAEVQRQIATIYSRFVITLESVGGLTLWLCRPRWASIGGAAIFGSIAVFSNFNLISVIAPLVMLSIACWPMAAERADVVSSQDDSRDLRSPSPSAASKSLIA
ncbi:MAG: hypothetical protein AAF670_17885 [Planctomycetota bacterium]